MYFSNIHRGVVNDLTPVVNTCYLSNYLRDFGIITQLIAHVNKCNADSDAYMATHVCSRVGAAESQQTSQWADTRQSNAAKSSIRFCFNRKYLHKLNHDFCCSARATKLLLKPCLLFFKRVAIQIHVEIADTSLLRVFGL